MKSTPYNIVNLISERTDMEPATVTGLMEVFCNQIGKECGALNRVAIPGFGSFSGMKHDEEIRTDLSTGKSQLFPPEIVIAFSASGVLKNRVK